MLRHSLLRWFSLLGLAWLACLVAGAADYRISGPYTHDNLSIYLFHGGGSQAGPTLLTLQEAMEQQKVVLYETGQVNQLSIENRSSADVYIQSGDIVKGGRQDRVLTTDMILPSHSGRTPITAFCVERGRWSKRGAESAAQFSASSQAVSFKPLKLAVRKEKDQSKVWAEVANAQRGLAGGVMGGVPSGPAGGPPPPPPASTSMQISLESRSVVDASDAYVRSLLKIIEGKTDVVGFAYAVNGSLNSADVYASPELFRKMWPKMLRSTAAEAVAGKPLAKKSAPPAIPAVKQALADADQAREASRETAGRVSVTRQESTKVILFESRDNAARNEWIHKSYVVK